MDNAAIADRLDAFATLLELADANPYQPRAYRRAAETDPRRRRCRSPSSCGRGRVRELRGIGPGIEARLRELVETGEIAELRELERELAPGLVGLGRFLGLDGEAVGRDRAGARRAHAGGVPRGGRGGAAADGARGSGRRLEARVLEALAREGEPRPPRGLLLDRRASWSAAIADALGGEPAGDARRWRDSCEQLAVVCAAADPRRVLERFAALPADRRGDRAAERRAVGVTVEGVPIELVAAEPRGVRHRARARDRLAGVRGGARAAAGRARRAGASTRALGLPWCPPELREAPFRGEPPAPCSSVGDIRGDLHCHTTWSDGRFSVEEMGRAARDRGYEYVAICDHTPAVGAVRGLTADDVRRQAEEIAAANEALAPFRVLRGIECDILPDGRLDLPDDVLAELDWVQASVHGGQRMPRAELTARVEEALRTPAVRCLSHPTGRIIGRRPENALDLDRVYEVALEHDVALEVNGLTPRLDLSGDHVRDALRAGVRIVCSTDAHSVRGLANMALRRPHRPPRRRDRGGRPQHPPARELLGA